MKTAPNRMPAPREYSPEQVRAAAARLIENAAFAFIAEGEYRTRYAIEWLARVANGELEVRYEGDLAIRGHIKELELEKDLYQIALHPFSHGKGRDKWELNTLAKIK